MTQTPNELNARRLLCPLPVIRTQDRIKLLKPDDILTVYCTDPGVLQDIPAWCRINGHEIIDISEHDGDIIIKVKVGNQ